MIKHLRYLPLWSCIFLLELYNEYSWIRGSLSDYPFYSILAFAIATELSLMTVRIPFAVFSGRVLFNKKLTWGLKTLLISLMLGVGVMLYRVISVFYILEILYRESPEHQNFFSINSFNVALINLCLWTGLFLAYRQYLLTREFEKKEKQLKEDKLATELKLLKAQLNPHFLFNTLNNIYGLARSGDKKTPDVILELSDLLRFMLYETNSPTITLRKELDILEKFISLEKLRYGSTLNVEYEKDISDYSFTISPLLIINLVENSFKHGISETLSYPFIRISIIQKGERCVVEIENSKKETSQTSSKAMGLKNVKRQLSLLYDQPVLEIDEQRNTFKVTMTLPNSL